MVPSPNRIEGSRILLSEDDGQLTGLLYITLELYLDDVLVYATTED
jgi:hypothetical protein